MLEFSFSFQEETERRQFISYALIVNTAGFTASTLHHNKSLDKYLFIKEYTVVLFLNKRQSANTTLAATLKHRAATKPHAWKRHHGNSVCLCLLDLRNVSHAGRGQREEAQHNVNM